MQTDRRICSEAMRQHGDIAGKLGLRMILLSFTARAEISLCAMSGTICAVWLTISTSRSCDLCVIYVTSLGYQYEND